MFFRDFFIFFLRQVNSALSLIPFMNAYFNKRNINLQFLVEHKLQKSEELCLKKCLALSPRFQLIGLSEAKKSYDRSYL